MKVPAAVREFLTAHRIEGAGVVAVSGGPDSVALLRALAEVGAGPLTVAHVNHQLRGAESDADEVFVQELAAGLGLPFVSTPLTVPADENLEGAARRLRYDWLHSVAGEANWIATGHTADDQAETVLHRLIRGTGLQGLRAIAATKVLSPPPLRGRVRVGGEDSHPNPTIPSSGNLSTPPTLTLPLKGGGDKAVIRPLLAVTRGDVTAYLAALGQPARTDASNADRRFTRNRIRHELLPLLRQFNPEAVAVLNRLADHAADAFDFIERAAADLLAKAERPRAGDMLILDGATLAAAERFLVREVFRFVWRREGWPLDAMTHAHWSRAAALTVGDYPAGVRLRLAGKVVQLERKT